MADRTIINPTVDQLEAGGTITGTYYGLRFVDTILVETVAGGLVVGNGVVVRFGRDTLGNNLTIESYTPPEPKQDSGPCFQDDLAALLNRYCAENVSGTPDFILAEMLTGFLREFNEAVSKRAEWRGESTGLPALIDTVPVSREALDILRRRHESNLEIDRVAVRHFLRAVVEVGGDDA